MRISLAQLNPTIGDIAGNARLVLEAVRRAAAARSDVLLTPELVIIGYPPRDLLLREGVVAACEAAVSTLAAEAGRISPELTVIIGTPRHDARGTRSIRNSAVVCRGGAVIGWHDKILLPGYDVFDEDRYFEPGPRVQPIDAGGARLGVLICEDIWRAADVQADLRYGPDPLRDVVAGGCDCVLALNASPFVAGKFERHVRQLRQMAAAHRVPMIAVNQVGANDDLIFDGRSLVIGADGRVQALLAAFEPDLRTIELEGAHDEVPVQVDPMGELWHALVLGLRDYCRKTRHERVLLGISGGIDSAIVATIAAAALGPASVHAITMPSRYSLPQSAEDAADLAARLGLALHAPISIEPAHRVLEQTLAEPLGERLAGVTDENLQARLRGILLMAHSNALGGLVLATSNKSELATGYSTLYGDMCGAVAVIGDLLKLQVYALARWINEHHRACGFDRPPIPDRSITRPPSAELRPDQLDQDTLPPYELLDEIVRRRVDLEESVPSICEQTGYDAGLVNHVAAMIDRAEYKRHQAPIVLKVSPRAFGRGRPMPIVARSGEAHAKQDEVHAERTDFRRGLPS